MSQVRVVSGTIEKATKSSSIVGLLRVGYTFNIGEDIVRGPAEISLDRKTAEAHLHKFDNIGEIKEFLGRPRQADRLNPRQRLEAMIKENQAVNALLNPAPAPAVREDSVAFKAAVQAEVKRQLGDAVKAAVAEAMDKATDPAKGEPKQTSIKQ